MMMMMMMMLVSVELVKVNVQFICIPLQALYATSVALCIRQAGVEPRPQPKRARGLWPAAIQPEGALVCSF